MIGAAVRVNGPMVFITTTGPLRASMASYLSV